MMKILITFFMTFPAFAAETADPKIEHGAPCRHEGERAYVSNGENQDVFYCHKGVWWFLYTRTPGDRND